MRNVVLVVFLGYFVSACAIGNTHRYDLGDASFDVDTDKTVAVTAVDARRYVQSGDKPPAFVGLMRGGFGNPFDVTTTSTRGLAEDMTVSITESLKASNVNAVAVSTPAGADLAAAREALLATRADRFALFLVREWKSDTYLNTALIYDVLLRVLRSDGSVIAEKGLVGRDNLGSGALPSDVGVKTESAFRQKLEEIFRAPDIKSALN